MVAVAVRDLPDAAPTCSGATPLPDPPPLAFSHPVLLCAVQAQPAAVVTCTCTVAAVDGTVDDSGETAIQSVVDLAVANARLVAIWLFEYETLSASSTAERSVSRRHLRVFRPTCHVFRGRATDTSTRCTR